MSNQPAPVPLRIDFVSDVSCPWCAVGLNALEQAIARVGDAINVELHLQPFELNPQMTAEGQDTNEHLANKYGLGPEQLAQNREVLRERGAELGFVFNQRNRIHNTFAAHRLLHWAALQDLAQARALKHALLKAYFTDGEDVSSTPVLQRLAVGCGLDAARAAEVLASDEYALDVRAQQQLYASRGIRSVPATIINEKDLISGGQPVETFERALRDLAGI